MDKGLALEIRKVAATFDEAARGFESDRSIAEILNLAANLSEALAHLVSGNGFRAAFGAPGDWGYNTPIGRELFKVYQGQHLPEISTPSFSHYAVINPEADIVFSTPISVWGDSEIAWDFCNEHINDCMDAGVSGAGRWVIRGVVLSPLKERSGV